MGNKRTKVQDRIAAIHLGIALLHIATEGAAVFTDPEHRLNLGESLRPAFPTDVFTFWRQEPGEKPQREAWVLAEALEELVRSQGKRLITSGTIEDTPLSYFRVLQHRQLSQMSEQQSGQTIGGKRNKPKRRAPVSAFLPSESPEEGALPSPTQRRHALAEQALERFLAEEERLLARLSSDPQAGKLSAEAVPDDAPFPDALESALEDELRNERRAWLEDGRLLPDGSFRGLTRGETRAFHAALIALYDGAQWHSRRQNSLTQYLPQAEMRALRRAFKKAPWMRPWLIDRAAKLTELRPRVNPGNLPKQRRIGDAFRDVADEAEAAGLSEVAAGLRAADRRHWGYSLSVGQWQHVEVARRWVRGDRRQAILDRQPDWRPFLAAALSDATGETAQHFLSWSLRLAVLCWPEGLPQKAG